MIHKITFLLHHKKMPVTTSLAVSYTHLDVYKRQLQAFEQEDEHGWLYDHSDDRSVSYTHLERMALPVPCLCIRISTLPA